MNRKLVMLAILIISSLFGLYGWYHTCFISPSPFKGITTRDAYIKGNAFLQKGDRTAGIEYFKQALAIDPEHLEARLQLAMAYNQSFDESDLQAAVAHFKYILNRVPPQEHILIALGNAYKMLGQSDNAIATYRKIFDVNPQSENALLSIGKIHEYNNRIEDAIAHYKQAIQLNPKNPYGHISLAGAYFAIGNFEEGYPEYQWRLHTSNNKNMPKQWDGSNLKSKTIIILSENGLGDIIQYVRFAQTIKEMGARVVVLTPKPLFNLLTLCPYIDEVVLPRTPMGQYDYITSMQSIPALTHLTLKTLPTKPYLFADKELVQEWKEKIASDKNFKIGLCWGSGGDLYHVPQGRRDIPIQELAPLAKLPNVSFYSLQKGPGEDKIAQANFKIITFANFDTEHGGFMDTAALMKNMDLIISVDTSVGHLAGALGIPTFLMLPFASDIRWMISRSDCPWYPTMKLFRQPKPYDWQSVITAVKLAAIKAIDAK